MDQHIAEYLDNLIKEHLNNPQFSNLTEEQKAQMTTVMRQKLYKASVEELINNLNQDQLNQIADLDFSSPEMEAKLEEFATTIPDFTSIIEKRFQLELINFSVN